MIDIETIKDSKRRRVCLVPLAGGRSGHAAILKKDFLWLTMAGVSPRWHLAHGIVRASVGPVGVSVARLLLDAQPGQDVHYLSGDKRDLRPENLSLKAGSGKYRERDFLLPDWPSTKGFQFIEVGGTIREGVTEDV